MYCGLIIYGILNYIIKYPTSTVLHYDDAYFIMTTNLVSGSVLMKAWYCWFVLSWLLSSGSY